MSQIQPYQPLALASRTGRALARLSNETALAVALVDAKADVEATKVDGVTTVAAKALHSVALLSQMEQSLAQTVPHASGRLATVADLAALSLAEVVANAAHKIGR